MLSAATIIAECLEDNNFGKIGENLFVSNFTELTPDDVIVVVDFGSFAEDSPSLGYTYPLVQIIVRSVRGGYQQCWDLTRRIGLYLNGLSVKKRDTRFIYVFVDEGPIDIGYDDTNRPQCSLTIKIMRTTCYYRLQKWVFNLSSAVGVLRIKR